MPLRQALADPHWEPQRYSDRIEVSETVIGRDSIRMLTQAVREFVKGKSIVAPGLRQKVEDKHAVRLASSTDFGPGRTLQVVISVSQDSHTTYDMPLVAGVAYFSGLDPG